MPYNYIKIEGQILSKKGKIAQKIIVADNVKPQNYNFISIKSDANFKTNIFSSKSKSYISLRSGMIYPEIDNPERFNYIVLKEIIGSEINANVVSNLDLKHAKYKSNYITILPQTFTTKLITVPNILDLHFIVPPPKEPSEIIIEPYKQDFIIGDMVSSLSLVGLQLFYEFFSNAYDLGSATKYDELFGNIYNLIRLDNLVSNSIKGQNPKFNFLTNVLLNSWNLSSNSLKTNYSIFEDVINNYLIFVDKKSFKTTKQYLTTNILIKNNSLINFLFAQVIKEQNTAEAFAHGLPMVPDKYTVNINIKTSSALTNALFYNYLTSYLFNSSQISENFLHTAKYIKSLGVLNNAKTLKNITEACLIKNNIKFSKNDVQAFKTANFIYPNKFKGYFFKTNYEQALEFSTVLLFFNNRIPSLTTIKKYNMNPFLINQFESYSRPSNYFIISNNSFLFANSQNFIVNAWSLDVLKRTISNYIINESMQFNNRVVGNLLELHNNFGYYTNKKIIAYDFVYRTSLKKTKYNYITLTQEYSVYTDKKYNWISIKPSFIKSKYNYIRIFDVPSKDDVKYIAFPFKPCTEVENDKLQIVVYLNDGRTVTFDLRLHKLIPIVSDMANIKNEVNHKIVLKGKEGAFIPEFEPAYIKAVDANIPGVEEIMRQLGFLDDIPTT